MNATRHPARSRARWATLAALCGMVWVLTADANAQPEPTRVGTVLGIPAGDLEIFRMANHTTGVDGFGQLVPANDVTVLHVSGEVATVSITIKGSGRKAWRVYFPRWANGTIAPNYTITPAYQQINANDFFTNPRLVNGSVLQMDVRQPDTGNVLLEDARFMLVPADRGAFSLQFANPNAEITRIHKQRMPSGTWVELVAIDRDSARDLVIPNDELARAIQALNSNVRVDFSGFADTNLREGRLADVR